jgi:hypothetical protein
VVEFLPEATDFALETMMMSSAAYAVFSSMDTGATSPSVTCLMRKTATYLHVVPRLCVALYLYFSTCLQGMHWDNIAL